MGDGAMGDGAAALLIGCYKVPLKNTGASGQQR